MNIKEAKEQIKRAMIAYFSKDAYGSYEIPAEKQRPVFLIGAPGIGKTAIMQQIAEELNVGLVSYSMTHHTRQSALGLPFITKKNYGGTEYDVSEYTMSEIISSIYEEMERTGVTEGILFLDEINCVTDTLAPSILLFLQYKLFGRHKIPFGWIVVTAGNPPEYNKSVREFDIVTLDRLKQIPVEPDFQVWKEYAYEKNVHPSILAYLEVKKDNFYRMESTASGKRFVTARGWEDLSKMIQIYEKNDLPVEEKLIAQYLQFPEIARDFSAYYDLFCKYRSGYEIDKILDGTVSDSVKERARKARFDERIALIGLLFDAITLKTRQLIITQKALLQLLSILRQIKSEWEAPHLQDFHLRDALTNQVDVLSKRLEQNHRFHTLSEDQNQSLHIVLSKLASFQKKLLLEPQEDFSLIQSAFAKKKADLDRQATAVGDYLTQIFLFFEEVYPDGQEILILVTELTMNSYTSEYISQYGCDKYFEHNKNLLFYERNKEIDARIQELNIDL
ncbi:MAG: AAA family ATPase [Clostridiales bacterium]|nr:AAA family ATPase [Clostridiales bacterium]